MTTKNPLTRSFIAVIVALACAAPAGANAVVSIPPSNDETGQADYEALQTAFMEATPGTNIRLEAGTYYLNHVLFAEGFRGVLAGAGMDRTIITSVGVLEAWSNDDDPPWLNRPSLENPWPALISFVDGNFTVRDMTFRITEYIPMVFEMFGSEFEVMAGIIYILGGDGPGLVHSAIQRVGFEGAPGTFGGYNVVQAVYHNGLVGETYEDRGFPVTGTHRVSDSSFETFYVGNSVYYLAVDANLRLKGNTFADVVEGLEVYDSGGRIDFSNNDVAVHPSAWGEDGYGVLVLQGAFTVWDGLPAAPPMSLSVRGNDFHVTGAVAAFDLEDWQYAYVGAPPALHVDVRDNVILADAALWGMYCFGLTDPRVVQNDFRGTVDDAGLDLELTADGLFILNDLQELETDIARCLLREDTRDNLVVCENAWQDVVDLTDNPATLRYDGANEIINVRWH